MAEPIVSVITPTWGRHGLLLDRCIPSVAAQDYPAVEHLIVSDGPDPELADLLPLTASQRYVQLSGHDPAIRWGVRARLEGIRQSRGEIICWLDDDNSFRPDHVSRLAALLEATGAGFAYSRVLFHTHSGTHAVGTAPPAYGQIDTSAMASRRSVFEVAAWRDAGQVTIDWDLAERWMQAGVTWVFDDEVTADYYVAGCT